MNIQNHVETIMVVDDVSENLQLLSRILTLQGYKVRATKSGREAVASVAVDPPDLVLLDIRLPDMSGLDVCRSLKANGKTSAIPIIFLSALNETTEKLQGFANGGVDYITKPFVSEEVCIRIKTHLDISRLRSQLEHEALKLRDSQMQYRSLTENSPDLIARFNRQCQHLYVNHSAAQAGLLPPKEYIGKTMVEVGVPEMVARKWEKRIHEAFETGKIVAVEDSFETTNGTEYYNTMFVPEYAVDGSVDSVQTIARNITMSMQALEKLRLSEERFKNIFENSPVGKSLTSMDGVVNVNQAFCTMLDYSIDELRGMKWQEITHPDDIEMTQNHIDVLIRGENESVRFEKRYLHKNGSVIWADVSTYLQKDKNGTALFYNTSVNNITERKRVEQAFIESERNLRASQVVARLGSYVWDITTGFWTSSTILDEIFGINESYTRSFAGWTDIVHPDQRTQMTEYVTHEVLGKHGRFDLEYRIIKHNDGQVRWVHGLGELEMDEHNAPFKLIGTIFDITDRKHAEEEIQKLNETLELRVIQRTEQLEAANLELEAFSYSVSHDLRAPLRHISGFINLFMEHKSSVLTDEELGYLNTVTNSANEMGALIDALLSFSRLNRYELKKMTLDTVELVQKELLLFDREISERAIEITIGALHETYGDQLLMSRVWANLISNAIKYTGKKDKAIIEIGSYVQEDENIFYVRDNGAGFNMKYVDKLFGVFQRLQKQRDFEGIGIGLAIMHRIISRHKGRCWAEGEVEKGATFYFSLPRKLV